MAGHVHQDNSVGVLGKEMGLRNLGLVLEGLCSPGRRGPLGLREPGARLLPLVHLLKLHSCLLCSRYPQAGTPGLAGGQRALPLSG